MTVEWTSELSVSIKKIDDQHQHLLSLAKVLEEAVSHNRGSQVYEQIFEELRDYAKYHFATEEDLMENHGFPDFENHRLAHERFIEKIMEFDFYPDQQTDPPTQILEFLVSWIRDHLLKQDQKFGTFCEENQIKIDD